jgi:hypothetical protein
MSLEGYNALTILEPDRVLATPGFVACCPGGSVAASVGTSDLAGV